jgi:hypothetical protein
MESYSSAGGSRWYAFSLKNQARMPDLLVDVPGVGATPGRLTS